MLLMILIRFQVYALRTTQVVSSPETQTPQNASRAHFVNSQTKRRHNKFPIFALFHNFLTEIPKGHTVLISDLELKGEL